MSLDVTSTNTHRFFLLYSHSLMHSAKVYAVDDLHRIESIVVFMNEDLSSAQHVYCFRSSSETILENSFSVFEQTRFDLPSASTWTRGCSFESIRRVMSDNSRIFQDLIMSRGAFHVFRIPMMFSWGSRTTVRPGLACYFTKPSSFPERRARARSAKPWSSSGTSCAFVA